MSQLSQAALKVAGEVLAKTDNLVYAIEAYLSALPISELNQEALKVAEEEAGKLHSSRRYAAERIVSAYLAALPKDKHNTPLEAVLEWCEERDALQARCDKLEWEVEGLKIEKQSILAALPKQEPSGVEQRLAETVVNQRKELNRLSRENAKLRAQPLPDPPKGAEG